MSRLLRHYSSSKTAFLCCDLQVGFSTRMANWNKLVFVANRFSSLHGIIPQHTKYIVTEQYPKALGKTVPDIVVPPSAHVFEKTNFSMLIEPVKAELQGVDQVVIFGIEAHVCVLQTIADLLDMNIRVAVARDGLASQKESDEAAAVSLMESWNQAGCLVSTSESIMFQLFRDAKDPNFKAMSNLAKLQAP